MRTFKIGGVHPHDNKEFSAHQPITACPLPKQAIIPLVQHIGAPAQAAVAVGAKVKVGELLAKAGGFVSANICSPVSGTVTKIGDWTDAWGAPGQAIFIDHCSGSKDFHFKVWVITHTSSSYTSCISQ